MIRSFVYTIIALILTASSAVAQKLPENDPRNGQFGRYFQQIQQDNTNIKDFQRMSVGAPYKLPNGATDYLDVKDVNGIWGREFEKFYGIAYNDFLDGKKPIAPTETATSQQARSDEAVAAPLALAWYNNPSVWLWLGPLLTAIILIAVVLYLVPDLRFWDKRRVERELAAAEADRRAELEHELRRDPVRSGPPLVPGGIEPTETERLMNFMDQQAVTSYVERHPEFVGNRDSVVAERIGPIEHGTIAGEGEVKYNAQDAWRPRRFDPQPGYRARYRFPDGTEEELMSLQICMNIVRAGGGMRGFTFTANAQNGTVVETPQPPAPAPTAVPHPAIAVARIRSVAETEGASTITVDGKIVTIERGAHFDLDKAPGAVMVTGGAFSMTLKLNRPKAKRATDRKTGT